ncbi:MAG TPA: O-methyltransferase [Acidimicrobiales bacterium]|nr:O-methyltransferase [Acidimicrobiales bacterium]
MNEELWTDVDGYLVTLLSLSDAALDEALRDSDAAGLPPINVAPNQGKLLELLSKSHGARRILEIGTLGGYSTTWLARSLPETGRLISLELEKKHADVARANIDRAGLGSLVEIRVGPAASSLRDLITEKVEPFDFIFIDADKEGYPEYFALSLELARVGTVIIADNVVRAGEIIDPRSTDERVRSVRTFLEAVALEDRVEATAIQTVGSKGYDGFAMLIVTK